MSGVPERFVMSVEVRIQAGGFEQQLPVDTTPPAPQSDFESDAIPLTSTTLPIAGLLLDTANSYTPVHVIPGGA
jgi:hypothetical protein